MNRNQKTKAKKGFQKKCSHSYSSTNVNLNPTKAGRFASKQSSATAHDFSSTYNRVLFTSTEIRIHTGTINVSKFLKHLTNIKIYDFLEHLS